MYPSKEEILTNIYQPSQEIKDIIESWKIKWYYKKWKKANTLTKIIALQDLTYGLVTPPIQFNITDKWYIQRTNPPTMGIKQDSLSIISCLHEIGHLIYGNSELKACTYSVGIFKECFPIEFSVLKWEGHMLRK